VAASCVGGSFALLVRFQNAEEVGPSVRADVDRHLWAEKAVCRLERNGPGRESDVISPSHFGLRGNWVTVTVLEGNIKI
jgi:hypothetical protein